MKNFLLFTLTCALLTACHGAPYQLKTATPESTKYNVLGEVEGSSAGFLLFAIIPIKKNDMIQRAFDEALLAKGADYLISPTVNESWYWTPIGNGFTTTVTGTAVKSIKP